MVVYSPAVNGGHPAVIAPAENSAKNDQQPGNAEEGVEGVENKGLSRQLVERHGQERENVRACEKDWADIWIMTVQITIRRSGIYFREDHSQEPQKATGGNDEKLQQPQPAFNLGGIQPAEDRKSTRLNSSHVRIS